MNECQRKNARKAGKKSPRSINNKLVEPEAYIVELHIPPTMPNTTVFLLSKLIHEYMVCRVLADWLGITHPESAAHWQAKAEEAERQIMQAKNMHRGAFTRATHPW